MFGKKYNLFKLLGFQVSVDFSWIIIAVLISWSLSTGFFPFEYGDLSTHTYWIMGVIAAMGLFLSIIVHEFSHSLVARSQGMSMKGITLFIFGGVAEMQDEPPDAKAEFLMSIVGPISSLLIGLLFFAVHYAGVQNEWPTAVNGVVKYLAFINIILAVFNLLPAFPLDGGRVLRSLLWRIKGNLSWATRISSQIGSFFGILLMGLGVYRMFYGNLFGGMWIIFIGLFLQNAARMSYQQLITRKALEGERVRRFMKDDPVIVAPSTTIEQLLEDYIYHYHFKMYPVVESDRLVGCVNVNQVKQVPREERITKTVGDLKTQCSPENTVGPEEEAVSALSAMHRTGISRLMVVENNRLIGIITLKDMLRFLSTKLELEEQHN
jgi:Zn-dependent protease/CBS domain-containing protein